MSKEEICESVIGGLKFVDAYVPSVTETILYSETIYPDAISKDLHKKLRRSLPVPVIYTTLMIIRRVAMLARLHKDAMDNDETVALPKSKTHVDHTVKKIYKKWIVQVSRYINENSDFQEDSWDPVEGAVSILETVADYNLKKFFGI